MSPRVAGAPASTRSTSSSQRSSAAGLRARHQKIHNQKSWSGSGNWSFTVARSCSSVVTPSTAACRTRREIWSTAFVSEAWRRCAMSASTRSSMRALALRAPRPVGSRQSNVPPGWISLGCQASPVSSARMSFSSACSPVSCSQSISKWSLRNTLHASTGSPSRQSAAVAAARRCAIAGACGSFQIGRPSSSRWRSCSGPDVITKMPSPLYQGATRVKRPRPSVGGLSSSSVRLMSAGSVTSRSVALPTRTGTIPSSLFCASLVMNSSGSGPNLSRLRMRLPLGFSDHGLYSGGRDG